MCVCPCVLVPRRCASSATACLGASFPSSRMACSRAAPSHAGGCAQASKRWARIPCFCVLREAVKLHICVLGRGGECAVIIRDRGICTQVSMQQMDAPILSGSSFSLKPAVHQKLLMMSCDCTITAISNILCFHRLWDLFASTQAHQAEGHDWGL